MPGLVTKIQKKISGLDVKTKKLLRNVVSTFFVKGLSLIVGLYTYPAYMKFFSNVYVLGLWFTVIAVLSWVTTFDLGIGNGLRNNLVKPITEKNYSEIKKMVSTAYVSIFVFIIFIFILFIIAVRFIDWNSMFKISTTVVSKETMRFMLTILMSGILLQFLLKLINSVFFALQRPAITNFLALCSAVLMLLFTSNFKFDTIETSVKVLSVAFIFTANIPNLLATIIVFSTKLKEARPSIKAFSGKSVKKIMNLGLAFFYLQIMVLLMFSTNEFLISNSLGPDQVVVYNIFNKIFSVICVLFVLALAPLWSAVTEAYVKKDSKWIKKIQSKLNLLLLLFVPLEVLIVVFMPFIQKIWLGNNAIPMDYMICFLLVIYNTLYLKLMIDANIINGIGKLKMQAVALTTAVILKFSAAYIMLLYYNSIKVILIANIVALIPCVVLMDFDVRNKIKNVKKEILNNYDGQDQLI